MVYRYNHFHWICVTSEAGRMAAELPSHFKSQLCFILAVLWCGAEATFYSYNVVAGLGPVSGWDHV